MTFTPTAALFKSTRNALLVFARHKPMVFKLAHDASEAGDAFVNDYARGLLGVTLEAIPEAAQRWVATKTEIPSPASFGMFARALDVEEFRSTASPGNSIAARRERWPNARAFWFDREGDPRSRSVGQWDATHAIAFSVPGTGVVGISDHEMDQLHARTKQWGWIEDRDLPAWALDLMGRPRPGVAEAQPLDSLLT
jgi:hypothetical protein